MSRRTKRTVHFYRVHGGFDDDGVVVKYPIRRALQAVESLPFESGGNYLEEGDGNVTCCWIDGCDRLPYRARIATVRREALPLLEKGGSLEPLPIDPDAGLAEETHVVFFQDGVVGILFNFYGPRSARLASYISAKCSDELGHLRLEALLRQDILTQLQDLSEVRALELRVIPSAVHILQNLDDNLGAILDGAQALTDAGRISIKLQTEPYARRGLGGQIMQLIRSLATRQDLGGVLDRFVVSGYSSTSESIESIDVLKEHLMSKQDVVLIDGRTRAIDRLSAFSAIEAAYQELRDDIARAAAVAIL